MEKPKMDSNIQEELKLFRSQLFKIDVDDEESKKELSEILDRYQWDDFEPFAEEYLIAGHDIAILSNESRQKIEKLVPDGELPSIRNGDATFWDRDRLMFCLVCDNEDVFAKGLKLLIEKKPSEISKLNVGEKDDNKSESSDSEDGDVETLETWRDISLVKVAVLRELNAAIEQLGALNSEINAFALRLIYEFGRWECVLKLLEKRDSMSWKPVKLADFISFLIRVQTFDKDFRENEDGNVDFGKCVDLLFKYAHYDVNEQNDDHYSPLHLAVVYNKKKIILDLLKNGAYIGITDKMDRPAIWNISPRILEKYFDHCIVGEDLIVFNFENLICPSDDYPNDMTAIEYISNSCDLKHLLEHPLIASFLFLKWNRLALLFYLDFVCYFLLTLAIGFASVPYIRDPWNSIVEMCVFTFLFVFYVTARRILQLTFCTPKHRTSFESYANTLLTILIVVLVISFLFAAPMHYYSSTVAAMCIILITYEFFTLAGTFWHFSIYAEMFIAVAKSSVKSLQLYAIFLPAFSLLFYILLGEKNGNVVDESLPNLNRFPTMGSSVVKTIVMSAGEFDMINVNFDANAISIYVFIGFLFMISIIFMNLLNGLAVSDTHAIQSKAELTSFWRRCQVLARYEEVLSDKTHWFRVRYRDMWKVCECFVHLNTFVYKDKRIYIELNDKRKIYSVKEMPSEVICLRVPLRSWMRIKTARMSPKIVHDAIQIREKHELIVHNAEEDHEFERERNQFEHRIVKIENTLKAIQTTLKAITKKLDER